MAAMRADGGAGFPGPRTALRPPGPTFARPRGQRRQRPKLAPLEPRTLAPPLRTLAPRARLGPFTGALAIAIPPLKARSEPTAAFAAFAVPVGTPLTARPETRAAFGITHPGRTPATTPADTRSLGGIRRTALVAVPGLELRRRCRRGAGRQFAAAVHLASPSRSTRAAAIPAEALTDPAADFVRAHLAVAVAIQLLQPFRRRADFGRREGAVVIGIEAGEESRQPGGPGRRHGRLRTVRFGVRLRGIALTEGGQAAQRGSQQGQHDSLMGFHGGSPSVRSVDVSDVRLVGSLVRLLLLGSAR